VAACLLSGTGDETVRVVRGIRDDIDDEIIPVGGSITSHLYPDDLTLRTEADLETWQEEIRQGQARKIRPGFYVGIEKLSSPIGKDL
jgi:hypothetical protein